jgi:exosortase
MRRSRLQGADRTPSLWGFLLLGAAAAAQLVGGYYRIESLDGLALVPALGGVCLLVGGRTAWDWAWPSIAFLAFMVPLPWRLETALGAPLQSLATIASTFLLQTLGYMAFADGNVIQLNDARIGVVDACNGLGMLMTFVALSMAAAILVRRPLLDKAVLIASAIPVALVANVIRIVLAGVLHEVMGAHASSTFYHDVAGWVMMPLALVLYWVEIRILAGLLIESRYEAPRVLDLVGSRRQGSPTLSAGRNRSSS